MTRLASRSAFPVPAFLLAVVLAGLLASLPGCLPGLGAQVLVTPAWAGDRGAPVDLSGGWEYRWGDSPFDDAGVPLWTGEDAAANGTADSRWRPIAFPSNPPNRNGQETVWYRLRLPEGTWRDPVLYVFSIDLIAEVYLGGQEIYHFGHFDENGKGRFEGWPWHIIELPLDFQGKTIYFRVSSDYYDIGLWGEVKLMEHLDVIRHIVRESQVRLLITALALVVAVIAVLMAVVNGGRGPYLAISVFTLSAATMLFGGSQAKQLLINAPLLWSQIDAAANFVMPVGIVLLFREWCGAWWARVVTALGILHVVYAVGAIGGSALGVVDLSSAYAAFEWILSASLLVLFTAAFAHWRTASLDQRILLGAFVVFSLFLLADLAVVHDLLPWTRMPVSWGLFVFSVTLIALALWRFRRTQKDLRDLNATLEHKVAERTRDLERSNADLKQFAYVISHDLQEPLRMVISYMQLLQRRYGGALDASAQEYIGFAIGGAKRMVTMIQGLLEFSRVDSQGQAFQVVPLGDAATDALRNLDVTIQTSGALVRVGDLPSVRADPTQVRSLLQNLIGNALKYRAADRTPEIRVSTDPGVHEAPAGDLSASAGEGAAAVPMVTIAVADNGIGIDPAFHQRVFRVFERLHGPHEYGGAGIGLAVCQRIVERHGGRIWIAPGPADVGTTVLFTLPAAVEA